MKRSESDNYEENETDAASNKIQYGINRYAQSNEIIVKTSLKKQDENYKMNHEKRGKALIFNHENFTGTSNNLRNGSKVDCVRLQYVLGDILKFDVEIHPDKTYKEIKEILKTTSKRDFTNEDCLAIFVLTHGNHKDMVAAKDKSYPVNSIQEYFKPDKCPTLGGKPKLFFINACRGSGIDSGAKYVTDGISECNDYQSYRTPLSSDILTVYSTTEGYRSVRNPRDGSWFIQNLCKTLENYNYRQLEIREILTIVSRETALKIGLDKENNINMQVPVVTSTLIRNLYFVN